MKRRFEETEQGYTIDWVGRYSERQNEMGRSGAYATTLIRCCKQIGPSLSSCLCVVFEPGYAQFGCFTFLVASGMCIIVSPIDL